MSIESALVDFLSIPANYSKSVKAVRHFETHISHVFTTGEFAYKIKKPVKFDFLDFSTLENRKHYCERECLLNSRFAPKLYIDVVPIFCNEGRLSFDRGAIPVEYCVRMREFNAEALFSTMAQRGELKQSHVKALVDRLVTFYQCAEIAPEYGQPETLLCESVKNLEVFVEHGLITTDYFLLLKATFTALSLETMDVMDRRRQQHVKRCHGDLHLQNICLFEGESTPFDGIEFNDSFCCTDVIVDFAFLLMDLWVRGQKPLYAAALNHYLELSDDYQGLEFIRYALAYRASVRAKVQLLELAHAHGEVESDTFKRTSQSYFDSMVYFASRSEPFVVAVGGISGSGKTTIARELSHKYNLCHIRSDVVRKRLEKVELDDHIPEAHYTEESNEVVYSQMLERASYALKGGISVVIDATFMDETQRIKVEKFTELHGVSLKAVWLTVPTDVAVARVRGRVDDASDANTDVVLKQASLSAENISWTTATSEGSVSDVFQSVDSLLFGGA